jgi:RsiW-degrading membrane proteinase PrsW (M82 family)
MRRHPVDASGRSGAPIGQTDPVRSDRRLATAIGLDVFVVILFVAIGRRNHDEGSTLAGVLETGAPFLIGLALAWIVVKAWRRPTAVLTGVAIWPITVLVGMFTRRLLFDRGTATAFVVVATIFLGVFLVGWRAAAGAIESRRLRTPRTVSAR